MLAETLVATNYPDIFFAPAYQSLFASTAFGGEPRVFEAAGIEYRFYVRPIEGTLYSDIVSPYGYSGPVDLNQEDADYNGFLWDDWDQAFDAYCDKEGIIADFARLHPWEFSGNLTGYDNHCHYEREVVYIDLTQSEEDIWKGFGKGCRGAIKKAERSCGGVFAGVTLEFAQEYRYEMQAKGATTYVWAESFFANAQRLLSGHVWTVITESGASCLILSYGDYAHYWLAVRGTGGGNSCVWAAIKWAKSQGCKLFNLGGGLKAGDSLEHFKRSFSKTTKPFYTYRKIHNQAVYTELCMAKGIDPASDGFFPAYRRTA